MSTGTSAAQPATLPPGPQALWVDETLRGVSATYNVPLAYLFNDAVDPAALQRALDVALDRHPALASRVLLAEDRPAFVPAADARCVLGVVDLTTASDQQRDDAVTGFVRSPLSLTEAPLLRAAMFRLAPPASLVVLVVHHGVFDGRSADVLRAEISRAYAAAIGRTTGAGPGPCYQGHAERVIARIAGAEAELIPYWTTRLAGAPPESTWPHDRPRPERPTHDGSHLTFLVPPGISRRLRRLADSATTTPLAVAAAALQVLLARVSPDDQAGDVVIGTPVELRSDAGEHDLIGYLANTIALRNQVHPDEVFADVLRHASAGLRDDVSHGRYPFPWLVKRLTAHRSLARPPLVQVLLQVDSKPAAALQLGGASGRPARFHNGTAKFDLTLTLTPEADGYAGGLEYSTELYDSQTAARIAETFVTLLGDAVSSPGKQVGDLDLVPRLPSPPPSTRRPAAPLAYERFAAQAAVRPDTAALRWDGGELSYQQLDRAAARMSARLPAAALAAGDVIAVCARRSPVLAVALLAILRAGAGYVPLDPAYPRERLDFMLHDSRASLLLCDDDLAGRITLPPGVRVLALSDVIGADPAPSDAPVAPVRPAPTVAPGDPDLLCYVIYTSGSTGQPRGVEMPHGPLANLLDWQAEHSAAGPGWRTLQFAPVSFDVAFQELFSTWSTGGTLVLIGDDVRRDPALLLDHLRRHEVHRLFLPFVALQSLTEAASELARFPLQLREVVTAGEQLVITPAIRKFFAQTGASLENQYGPSETHVVTAERLPADPSRWPDLPSIGAAITGTVVRVFDARGHQLPPGVPGEIWVAGQALAKGYRDRPELTAERFVTGTDGQRYYRTGDFGRQGTDGRLGYLGRRDGQVKVRGYRVELGEVEAYIKAQPGVADAVVALHDAGLGGKRLVAHCLPAHGARLSRRELRRTAAEGLPDYMVPAAFVFLPAFPLTPSGKVDRRALALTASAAGEGEEQVSGQARDDVEIQLCDIWRQVLGRGMVGVHDDFFELGGDSFLGIRMVAAVRRLFGIDLAVADLFAAPTVAALAELIRTGPGGLRRGPLVRLQAGDGSNPIYAFHPLPGTITRYAAFARALGPDQTTWGLQSVGLQPGEAPLESVPEMADLYLSQMRTVHPGGPWHLVGYSMGGTLAVEVARRLGAAGEQVGLIGLFDTRTDADLDEGTGYATRILVRMGLKVNADIGHLLGLTPAERTSELLRQGIAAGTLPADYDDNRLRRMLDMYQHNGAALAAHQLAPYDGRVVLFRALDRSLDAGDLQEDLGWRSLARELILHDVPGDHHGMMAADQVEILAGLVRRYVRGA